MVMLGGIEKRRYAIAGCASVLLIAFSTVPQALSQNVPTLTERTDQVDTCRGTTTPLTIYTTSTLTGAIGRVLENSSVTLTGIFGTSVVQIKSPQLGWIASSTLISNCGGAPDGGLPVDFDTNPQYCRRLRSVELDGTAYADLNTGLVARNTANGEFQFVGNSNQTDGPKKAAVVRFTDRAADLKDAGGRRWIRIKYTGLAGLPRLGWVPNGPEGVNRNIAACTSGQN